MLEFRVMKNTMLGFHGGAFCKTLRKVLPNFTGAFSLESKTEQSCLSRSLSERPEELAWQQQTRWQVELSPASLGSSGSCSRCKVGLPNVFPPSDWSSHGDVAGGRSLCHAVTSPCSLQCVLGSDTGLYWCSPSGMEVAPSWCTSWIQP